MWGVYVLLFLYFKNHGRIPLKLRSYGCFGMQMIALVQFLVLKKTMYDLNGPAGLRRTCPLRDWVDAWMIACQWLGALSIFMTFAFGSRYGSPGDKLCYDVLQYVAACERAKRVGDPKPEKPAHLRGVLLGKWLSPTAANKAGFPRGTYKFYQFGSGAEGLEAEYGDGEALKKAKYYIMYEVPKPGEPQVMDARTGQPVPPPIRIMPHGFVLAQWHHDGPKRDSWSRQEVVPARAAISSGSPFFAALAYFVLDAAFSLFGCFLTVSALERSCIDDASLQLKVMLVYSIAYLVVMSLFGCTAFTMLWARMAGVQSEQAYFRAKRYPPVKNMKEQWAVKGAQGGREGGHTMETGGVNEEEGDDDDDDDA
eukprot:g2923.t1